MSLVVGCYQRVHVGDVSMYEPSYGRMSPCVHADDVSMIESGVVGCCHMFMLMMLACVNHEWSDATTCLQGDVFESYHVSRWSVETSAAKSCHMSCLVI